MVNINIICQHNPTKFVLYQIKNKTNNKVYIGQSTHFIVRVRNHIKSYIIKTNLPLYRAINKYGINMFDFSIIDYANSGEEMNEKEIFYIKKYNSANTKYGYNIALGGMNSKQTPEWINKRIHKSGSEEAKKYGKEKTEEDRLYLSENSPKFWLGKKRSDETKEKIRRTKILNGAGEKNKELFGKTVIAYNPINNEMIETFKSTADAGEKYNISQSTISRRCSGVTKNKGDVYFRYENEQELLTT